MKIAQTSLITYSGNLSKAHMDYLQGLQDAINKQDPQAIAANTQVHNIVTSITAGLSNARSNIIPGHGAGELGDNDVYAHGNISYKDPKEGTSVGY